MQLSVLPNILILNRDCRKSKLAVKFSTLYCIYSFIMIILYHSFTDCCAVKISVGSQSDLSCNLNHHHTLHLYCFQSIKHFQVPYLILFDSQNNTAGKEGQYTCAVQKKTDTDRKFHRAPFLNITCPSLQEGSKSELPIGAQERRHQTSTTTDWFCFSRFSGQESLLIQGFAFHGSRYEWSIMVWKYYMENYTNEQFMHFKLLAIWTGMMKFFTFLLCLALLHENVNSPSSGSPCSVLPPVSHSGAISVNR